MRISDWSSDVCSSDLSNLGIGNPAGVHDLFSLGGSISYEVDVVGRIRRAIEAATADEQAQAAALDLASRSEEHTSELQSLMRISYAVFCLKKKTNIKSKHTKHKKQ